MSSDSSDELLDVVDGRGRVIGQFPRAACHGDPSLAHRVVHIHVWNSRGELLLQKRGLDKEIQPGRWDTSVGGHLAAGEGYEEAAVREIEEELGIEGADRVHMYDYVMRNEIETEHVRTFYAIHDGPFTVQRSEIDGIRFWSFQQIEADLGSGLFTPNFEEEWARCKAWRDELSSRGIPLPF